MYLYAQKTDNKNETWDAMVDSDMPEILKSYKHMSVYMQSDRHFDGMDYSKVRLKGDLQLDIDAKDLGQAITWCNRFMDHLEKLGFNLEYLKTWCSGSKGFHITIPQRAFADDKQITLLNKYHKWMVAKMSVEADVVFDMALYHNRHLIRVPGSQRADGRWKVPVTVDEVRNMTPGEYLKLVQNPRQLEVATMVPQTYFCEKLGELWARAKEQVKQEAAKQARQPALHVEELDIFTDDNVPQCIEWMRDNTTVKAGFNDTAMQYAAFLSHAANITLAGRDKLIHEFAKHNQSDSRPSLTQRITHVNGAIRWAEGGCRSFSCAGARSVLSGNPCTGCPIKTSQQSAAEVETQIEAGEDGYYVVNSKGDRRKFTTFTMERLSQVNSYDAGNTVFHADIFEVTSRSNGGTHTTTITIPAEDWTSVSAFKKQIAKVAGAVMLSSAESELANLQNYLNSTQIAEVLLRVNKAGIHVIQTNDKEQKFWAENDWSLDAGGTSGQHTYTGEAGGTIMSLRGVDTAKPTDEEAIEILSKLMNSNLPATVGQLLGWSVACHLKEHLYRAGFHSFPLLHLAGQPGSGKSSTAVVYSALTGANLVEGGPMVVDTTTPSPLRQAITETNTIARVFDEFNKPNMPITKYLYVLGLLKAAFCRQNMAMGYVKKGKVGDIGAATHHQYATSPLIYMSREPVENEELIQRSIILRFDKEDHKLEKYEQNFLDVERSLKWVTRDGHPIQRLTKLLVKNAIETPVEQVNAWYQEVYNDLPTGEHTRRVYNLFTIRLGLKFLSRVLDGFPAHLTEKLQELDEIVVKTWKEEEGSAAELRRKWSTTESLISTLNVMAQIPEGDRTPGRLAPGHYIKSGSTLYINSDLCFPAYRLYTKTIGIIADCSTPHSMTELLKKAKYCLGVGGTPGAPSARNWVALDLSQLRERGIYGEGFKES